MLRIRFGTPTTQTITCYKKEIDFMLTNKLINECYDEVIETVDESIELIKQTQKRENDFILFFAECSLKIENGKHTFWSSFSYESLGDLDRLKFIDFYLNLPFNKIYEKSDDKTKSDLRKNLMFLELMIYSHTWESIPNLKILFRISEISQGKDYPWQIDVPEMSKHNFIRNDVRDKLGNGALKLKELITNSFHSQIRNAFAHSQISFWNNENEVVQLHNFNSDDNWTQWGMSFEELEIRVAKSILLFKLIPKKIHEEVLELTKSNKVFTVYCPEEDWTFKEYKLEYDADKQYFKWP